MKIPATDGLVCPQCQARHLDRETIFYDALVSDTPEHFRYTCRDCGFIFEVDYETIL